MAVQKSKKSRSKRGMRRAHDFLTPAQVSKDKTFGTLHLRHHVMDNGYYRGKKVIDIEKNSSDSQSEEQSE